MEGEGAHSEYFAPPTVYNAWRQTHESTGDALAG